MDTLNEDKLTFVWPYTLMVIWVVKSKLTNAQTTLCCCVALLHSLDKFSSYTWCWLMMPHY